MTKPTRKRIRVYEDVYLDGQQAKQELVLVKRQYVALKVREEMWRIDAKSSAFDMWVARTALIVWIVITTTFLIGTVVSSSDSPTQTNNTQTNGVSNAN